MTFTMNFQTIRNPLFKVMWAGWEISAMQDPVKCSLAFAFKHPQYKMYGVSQKISDLEFQRHGGMESATNFFKDYPIVLWNMACKAEIVIPMDLNKFQPINAEPEFVTMERKSIEDFKIFRPLNAINEIVIAEPSITQMLNDILKYQEPKQKEIRERRRREMERNNWEAANLFQLYPDLPKTSETLVAQVLAVA